MYSGEGNGFTGIGENGFIGLNMPNVWKQIDEFIAAGVETGEMLSQASRKFMDSLASKWASKNAVEFSRKFNSQISELESELRTLLTHRVHGINEAGRALAQANGESWRNAEFNGEWGAGSRYGTAADNMYGKCGETYNGITGMAVENVKIILSVFLGDMMSTIECLESAPRAISFYSTDGALVSQYALGVEKLIEKYRETLSAIEGSVKGYIETEADNILLAKEQAAGSLNA